MYAQQSLIKWEPRIEQVQVNTYPDPDSENTLLIQISYVVRSTNNLHNLVYPFYLRREQDL
jgi:predicted component of type VI protein secretion system